ncbi:MAG: transcriptional repressor [Pirellulales bacterium]|nr:transcriptional repressor [Pirellulales bacterium]
MPDNLSHNTVEVALTPWERFAEYLHIRNKRITQQRRVLLDLVFEAHEHFDADDLVVRLGPTDAGKKIGRATIYRTLNELVEAGLLRRMVISGRSVYEHDYGYPQHDHLHCTACNRLIEFRNAELVALRDTVAMKHSFRATGHRFIILGLCRACQARYSGP